MADRGIIFSAPMVRALLDGRKTQTRRLLNPQPSEECHSFAKVFADPPHFEARDANGSPCHPFAVGAHEISPYPRLHHAVGDRLYVRETCAIVGSVDPGWVLYRANGYKAECERHGFDDPPPENEVRWRPSIHMPRWASRLTLMVTDVRVQRLQDISEEDAQAEGIVWQEPTAEDREWAKGYAEENGCSPDIEGVWTVPGAKGFAKADVWGCTARDSFHYLWNTLHDKPGTTWADDPWVYALTFEVVRKNIDGVSDA